MSQVDIHEAVLVLCSALISFSYFRHVFISSRTLCTNVRSR